MLKMLGGLGQRGLGLGGVVHAAYGLQLGIGKRLHADRQARDASGAVGGKAVFFKSAGVGF